MFTLFMLGYTGSKYYFGSDELWVSDAPCRVQNHVVYIAMASQSYAEMDAGCRSADFWNGARACTISASVLIFVVPGCMLATLIGAVDSVKSKCTQSISLELCKSSG